MARGGAETMLANVIRQLTEYNNIIVTLHPENEFGKELDGVPIYCLHLRSNYQLPLAAIKLRRFINKNNVQIVHSHLLWSTVIARMGTPKKIPLITTIHTYAASAIEYSKWYMRLIERFTYGIRKSVIVSVANVSLDAYFSVLALKPHQAYTLHTFVDTAIFNNSNHSKKTGSPKAFRMVTVGNLKEAKNYFFLLEAFKKLKQHNISLDIYGKGPLDVPMQKMIDEYHLNVTLKGQAENVQERLKEYDLFIMSSLYEGFSISVLEAMALGMPLLLSDIASFREQCEDTAVYYNLKDSNDFITKLLDLINNKQQRAFLGNAAKERLVKNFTLDKHMHQLKKIYISAFSGTE
jgi:glycosyltransferase involved in cell wall biosynthesis